MLMLTKKMTKQDARNTTDEIVLTLLVVHPSLIILVRDHTSLDWDPIGQNHSLLQKHMFI